MFALEAHCLEGRAVHRATVSRYRAAEEAGSRVGCQGLETAARVRTRGAGLPSLEGMGPKRFVLSVDDDTEFRSRCE